MLIYALVAGVLFGLYFSLVGIGLNHPDSCSANGFDLYRLAQ